MSAPLGRPFFDLQFFAEERTESATPRKRQKTRAEGQTAKSQDMSAAVVIIAGLLAVNSLGPAIWSRLILMFSDNIAHISSGLMQGDGWLIRPTVEGLKGFLWGWLPIGLLCCLAGVSILVRQVGFVITTQPLKPKMSRFNPVSGLKKIMSPRTMVEVLKGLLKALLLLWILFILMRKEQALLLSIMQFPMAQGTTVIMREIWRIAFRMALALLLLGYVDYRYQKWDFEKSIRMSKQEVKEEYKQTEGDPLVKRRIRQKQRELAMKRMMSDVPKADVVVTNPTHIAVAIKYDQKSMSAPVVIAKGEGFVAQKIKDIANEHKIPIVENKPLARALLLQVEVGEAVPEDLYRAVAEVLAFVYRLKAKS